MDRSYNLGDDIGLTLQLLDNNGDFVDSSTVTFTVYESDGSTVAVSGSAPWNNTLKCYFNEIDVSVDWPTQTVGNYLLVWTMTGLNVASPRVEELCILETVLTAKIDRVLGLAHENVYIDQASYDTDNNLIGARLRVYSDPASVGTSSDVIGTYSITSVGSGAGKFLSWKQIKQ